MINKKYYTENKVNEQKFESGAVFVPYIISAHTQESLIQYNDFMKSYHNLHKCCPKCGDIKHTSTLMGFPLHWEKKEEYRDLNSCSCLECGDVHSMHDRTPFT